MTIYRSPTPDVKIPNVSLFTFLFEGKIDKEIPGATPIFIDADTRHRFTRSEFKAASLSLGWGLRNVFAKKLGGVKVTKGDTVMIFSPNCLAWPLALFASIAAGFRTTLSDPLLTSEELAPRWEDSRAKVIFTDRALVPVVVEMLEKSGVSKEEARKRIVIMGVGDKDATTNGFIHMDDLRGGKGRGAAERFDGKSSNETVFLCYSSGTTGKSKGIELTHRNIVANCLMLQQVFPPTQIGVDVMLGIIPLYRIFGAQMLLPFSISIGLPVVIMSRPGLETFFHCIEKFKVTISLVVPTLCLGILHHPAMEQYKLESLRVLMSGGAPLKDTLVRDIQTNLKCAGSNAVLLQGYGLTEMSPVTHMLPYDRTLSKAGSVGLLLPNLEARLVGENGADIQSGELWLRGPTVMKGYWGDPEGATTIVDGWCRTGDIFTRDNDGYYYFKDRIKDLIKYKDHPVFPAEIEELLMQHSNIIDAAVIGVNSDEGTDLPMAYVVPKVKPQSEEECTVFSKEIQKWVRGQVANHQYLRGGVVIIDQIPKNGAGKVLRRQLRNQGN